MELALALLFMLVFLVVGLSTLSVGRRVAREFGPETRMRIPRRRGALEAWISDQTGAGFSSAKNFVRIGWVWLLLSPLAFPLVYGLDAFNPVAIARRAKSVCRQLVTPGDLRTIKGWNVELDSIVDEGGHCRARWVKSEGKGTTPALSLDLGPGGSFAAGSLRERRARNQRSSTPRPVRDLVEGTVWLSGPSRETVFLELGDVALRLEIDAGALSRDELRELVARILDRHELTENYRGGGIHQR